MDTFAGSERSAEEEDRVRRGIAEKVVKAGAAESFLAKAQKELPPEEFERVRQSVVEAESWWQLHSRGVLSVIVASLAVGVMAVFLVALGLLSTAGQDATPYGGSIGPIIVPTTTGRPTTTTIPGVSFGQAQTLGGNTVTVYSAVVPAQPDPDVTLTSRPGMVFVAVDAEVCATADEGIAQDWWFMLGTPSASRTVSPIRQPALTSAQPLAVGSCVRGWVSFEVPDADSQHVDVYFRVPGPAGSSTELRWG